MGAADGVADTHAAVSASDVLSCTRLDFTFRVVESLFALTANTALRTC